jgi:hypothetical protein
VPIPTDPDSEQRNLLHAVRQSQAAALDALRTWSTLTGELARGLRLPLPPVDLAGVVDRVFDLAEQTLAAQRQLARSLAGGVARQLDTAAEAAGEAGEAAGELADTVEQAADDAAAAADDAAAAAAAAAEPQPEPEPAAPPQAGDGGGARQRRPDRRSYEERTVEELRERAAELQIEGRSAMGKEELVAALRSHRRRPAKRDASKRGG